jgi:hypothetical protein
LRAPSFSGEENRPKNTELFWDTTNATGFGTAFALQKKIMARLDQTRTTATLLIIEEKRLSLQTVFPV